MIVKCTGVPAVTCTALGAQANMNFDCLTSNVDMTYSYYSAYQFRIASVALSSLLACFIFLENVRRQYVQVIS